jgi:gluconokinase
MIIIVGGVSGSGKTTVGSMLAGKLDWPFADADDFHPPVNLQKMRDGVPLTDEDRMPWLRAIGVWMDKHIAVGDSAVVTCSALRRAYRDVLLSGRPEAWLVFLTVDPDELRRRVVTREGHFFPAQLLDSQLSTVQLPGPDEHAVVIESVGTPAATVAKIVSWMVEAPR